MFCVVDYSVHPHPIYYPSEPADVIYFSGDTIEFTCDVFCERHCESLIYYNKSSFLLDSNIYNVPFNYELDISGHPAKRTTLKITNANASTTGSYQCLTKVWKKSYVFSKEINFRMTGMTWLKTIYSVV